MAIQQLRLLINLAQIDGEVAEKEMKYITTIGLANGVSPAEMASLFNEKQIDTIIPTNLSEVERFNYIFSLVQLMKIDERLYQDEIRFCSKVAARLGYEHSVIFDLMLHVRAVMEKNELDALKDLTAKYLKSK